MHGTSGGISDMEFMGMEGSNKRGTMWIFCYMADFGMAWCIGWRTYGQFNY